MRRLIPLALSLASACTTVSSTPVSGYPAEQDPSGSSSSGNANGSSSDDPSPPGSTPSPVWHPDAGAENPSPAPAPIPTQNDAGTVVLPLGEDGGAIATTPDAGASNADDAGSPYDAVLASCVGGINAFRGQNDLFAYARSPELEAYAAQAAAADALSGQQDGFFDQNGGNNVSFGEDEFDGQRIDPGATAQEVLNQGLIDEEEGEIDGDGNLLSGQFSSVGCGVAQASDGSYWIAIEYQ